MRRRVVVFDMMDTLLTDPYREALEVGTGRSLTDLRDLLVGTRWPDFECNRITEREYLAAFVDAGVDVDLEAFHRARREGYGWIDGMEQLLEDLADVETVVASNYPDWLDEVADDWFRHLVDGVIGSCHLGERKPDRAFFDAVLAWLDADADDTWFVDDRLHNVEAAAADIGMHALHFTSATDTRAWLEDEGVLAR